MTAERIPTGEHSIVVQKNGAVTWKWLVGTIVTVGIVVVAGVIAIKTDIAGMKVDIQYIKDTIITERGMAERHDREIRNCVERIIKLEAKP